MESLDIDVPKPRNLNWGFHLEKYTKKTLDGLFMFISYVGKPPNQDMIKKHSSQNKKTWINSESAWATCSWDISTFRVILINSLGGRWTHQKGYNYLTGAWNQLQYASIVAGNPTVYNLRRVMRRVMQSAWVKNGTGVYCGIFPQTVYCWGPQFELLNRCPALSRWFVSQSGWWCPALPMSRIHLSPHITIHLSPSLAGGVRLSRCLQFICLPI